MDFPAIITASRSSKLRTFCLSLSPDGSAVFQDAQENHGLAVPTPCVPDSFADKQVTGKRTPGLRLVHLSNFLLKPKHLDLPLQLVIKLESPGLLAASCCGWERRRARAKTQGRKDG